MIQGAIARIGIEWLTIALALVLAVVIIGGSGWLIGSNARNTELAQANERVGQLRERAGGAESAAAELRQRLASELALKQAVQQAVADAMTDYPGQIVALQSRAAQRQADLKQDAAADEDCLALLRQPVCAAVAGRLFGAPRNGGTY